MPPKSFPNPTPKTESAREALKSFFCELCQKGYSRINEFEAHESSYDHQHKKRLKEMKQMQREGAASKARRAERKADEKSGLISLKPMKMEIKGAGGGGFRKGGFKNAFAAAETTTPMDVDVAPSVETDKGGEKDDSIGERQGQDEDEESDLDDGGEDAYDPRRPTDCHPQCPGYLP